MSVGLKHEFNSLFTMEKIELKHSLKFSFTSDFSDNVDRNLLSLKVQKNDYKFLVFSFEHMTKFHS